MADNAAANPDSGFAHAARRKPGSFAGVWIRLVALQIDFLIAALLGVGAVTVLSVFVSLSGVVRLVADNALMLLVFVLYFGLTEGSSLRGTAGKRLLNLRVADRSGAPIGLPRALVRGAFKTLGLVLGGMLFLPAAFDRKKRAVHDLVASTMVVRKERPAFLPERLARYEALVWCAVSVLSGCALMAVLIKASAPALADAYSHSTVARSLEAAAPLQRRIAESIERTGAAPSDITVGTLNAVEMPPGARVGYLPDRGSLHIRFTVGNIAAGTMSLHPHLEGGRVAWRCFTTGVREEYRPAQCD